MVSFGGAVDSQQTHTILNLGDNGVLAQEVHHAAGQWEVQLATRKIMTRSRPKEANAGADTLALVLAFVSASRVASLRSAD
jgi:hypothetical protein